MPSVLLSVGDDGLKINAGAMHSVTRGSVLAVSPPPGKGKSVLGHVLITEARTFDADVEPYPFADEPLVKELPDGGAYKPCSTSRPLRADQPHRLRPRRGHWPETAKLSEVENLPLVFGKIA